MVNLEDRILALEAELSAAQEKIALLERKEQLLQAILDHPGAIVRVADDNGVYTSVSRGAELLFGISAAEMREMSVVQFAGQAKLQEYRAKGELFGEFEIITPDGARKWAEYHGKRMGQDLNVGILTDVTRVKLTTKALAAERHILQTLINKAHTNMVFLDNDFRFLAVNESYAATCQRTPQELLGQKHFDFYPHAENEAIFKQVRDTGQPIEFKAKPFVFPDQPERGLTYWDWRLSPVLDPAGESIGLLFTLVEVTEQARLAESLREANGRLSAILEHAPLGIVVLDPDLCIRSANPSFEQLTGRSADELRGQAFVALADPADQPALKTGLSALLNRKRRVFQLDLRCCAQNTTEYKWVRLTASLLPASDKAERIIGMLENIQDHKETTMALDVYLDGLENLVFARTRSLEESLASVQALLNATPDDKILINRSGIVIQASDSVRLRTGVHPEGRTYAAVLPAAWNAVVQALVQRCFESGQSVHSVDCLENQWLDLRAHPVTAESGGVDGAAIIVSDVSRQKFIDQSLDRNRQELAALVQERTAEFLGMLHSLPVGLLLIDLRDGRLWLAEANEHATRLMGLEGSFAPMPLGISAAPQAAIDALERAAEQVFSLAESKHAECTVVDGGRRTVFHLYAFPLADVKKVGVMLDDITLSLTRERQRDFLELRELKLRKLGHDLHDVLGGQLSGLMFLIGSLKEHRNIARDPVLTGTVDLCVRKLQEAIGQVRNYSRRIATEPQSLEGFIASVQQLMEEARENFGAQGRLNVDAKNLKSTAILTHLLHIVREAITNSCKHGRARQIDISLVCQDGQILLEIANDGVPLPPEGSTASGLGLKIMRARLAQFDGALELLTPANGGVCYRATLPHLEATES